MARRRVVAACVLCVAVIGAASGAGVDWAPADPAYRLSLPRDHGSHPQHRLEWWYYTGNVDDAQGRRFGYQLTFFRVGIDPQPVNPSRWTVRDLYMAHFAITDARGRRYRAADRLNRAGVGWAGAAVGTLRVVNDDWSATLGPGGEHVVRARDGDMAIDLVLGPGKPFVAHGREGYSQKGRAPGNASHYYSLTRMPTRGTIAFGGAPVAVRGESWMDHEFGSSVLEAGQQGWDWLSIQLDDRTELMLFQIRPATGGAGDAASGRAAPQERAASGEAAGGVGGMRASRGAAGAVSGMRASRGAAGAVSGMRASRGAAGAVSGDSAFHANGTMVDASGRAHALEASAFTLRPRAGATWTSPRSGARYPVAWQIAVPSLGLMLDVRAVLDGQELHTEASTRVTYWEGAIDVVGTRHARPIRGRGYLEMTGYTGSAMSDILR